MCNIGDNVGFEFGGVLGLIGESLFWLVVAAVVLKQ